MALQHFWRRLFLANRMEKNLLKLASVAAHPDSHPLQNNVFPSHYTSALAKSGIDRDRQALIACSEDDMRDGRFGGEDSCIDPRAQPLLCTS
jgi:hypothetical protein